MRSLPLFLIALSLCGCGSKKAPKAPAPPKVTAQKVEVASVPHFLDGVGQAVAYYSVDIKAQAEGYLQSYSFQEGQTVEAGAILYTIDPSPYAAKLASAKALLAENVANYRYAAEKVKSYEPLLPEQYVSPLNLFEYQTNATVYQAAIQENEAQVDLATINLNYCFIKAPFKGRVGKRLVDPGHLITNDGSTLVTITSVSPIYIDFSLPEKELYSILKGQKEGDLLIETHVPGSDQTFTGKLTVIDNFVNTKTGMIPLRAECPNEEGLIWPGQFVKTRLLLKEVPNAIVIPEGAVLLGQQGFYVYTVEDGKAKAKAVTKGQVLSQNVVIESGLEPNDLVITSGMFRLRDGIAVEVISG